MADQKNNLAVPGQEQHNLSSQTSTVDTESANPWKGANVAAKDDVERAGPNTAASWWRYLNEDVDTAQTTSQLALYCFMTGYIGVISFSAIFVWCGFQKACYRLSTSLLRTFGVPRHFVPQSRSTSTNLANLLQCRRVHRPHWRSCGCPQAYMAHRRHLIHRILRQPRHTTENWYRRDAGSRCWHQDSQLLHMAFRTHQARPEA